MPSTLKRIRGKLAYRHSKVVANLSSPETVLVLRALSKFEAAYLSRSSSKLNETVAQAFARGAKTPPGHNDGLNIARNIINELDSARFDPLLVRAVAKGAASCLDILVTRANAQVSSWP